MTMEELHEKRGEYVKRVRAGVADDLLKNGLELEAASLTQLDQTGLEFFNPSNAFDAEGMTRLTEQIERRKKQRNDIEQDTMISIRTKNLEAEKLSLDIDREAEHARLTRSARSRWRAPSSAPSLRASAPSASRRPRARRSWRARRSRSRASCHDRSLEEQRIGKERDIQGQEIERRKALELAEQQRAIEVAEQSKAESEARAAADQARAPRSRPRRNASSPRARPRSPSAEEGGLIEASQRRRARGACGCAWPPRPRRRPPTTAARDPRAGRGRGRRRQDPLARDEDPP